MRLPLHLRLSLWLVAVAMAAAVAAAAATAAEPEAEPGDEAVKAYLAGRLAQAERLLVKEIARGNARSSRYLLLARVRFLQEKWPGAQETLEALLARDAEHPQGRELLGRVLFRRKRDEAALPYYEESLRGADRPELRLEMGEVLMRLGRKTEAVQHLGRVVEDKRPWPRAHYLLGSLRLESGLGHWAAKHLWAALRLGCREPVLRLRLAEAFHMEGRVTGPLLLGGPLRDAKSGDRIGPGILVRRAALAGEGFWHAAGPDTAIYQIEAALTEGKVAAAERARLLAARCWLDAGALDRAAHYARLLRTRSPEVFDLRARLALDRGDLAGFRRLLGEWPAKARPEPEGLVRLLVRASLEAQVRGELEPALALLEEAERARPGRSEVLRPMVAVLDRMGRTEEAGKKMQLLAELHPESPQVRLLASRYGVDFEALEREGAPVLEPRDGGGKGREAER